MTCCVDSLVSAIARPSVRMASDSTCSVAEKAQHEPQSPWSLMAVVYWPVQSCLTEMPAASGGHSFAPTIFASLSSFGL